MPLNSYQKMCYRWFGNAAENAVTERLEHNLEKAHVDMRAGAYLSYTWVNTLLMGIATSIIAISLILFLSLDFAMSFFIMLLVGISTIFSYYFFINYPSMKAKARGKQIELHLPYALNFIAAMSAAGVTPTEIFKSLSKQRIYGEIREEALWIFRDVELLGRDIISSIKANINRTPSEKFKEFLQGAVVTVQSGGALKPYFMNKAEQYTRENRITQKQMLESLGIMAEAYVSAAVAGVLMVLVVIPLLIIMQGAAEQLSFLYVFIVIVIPLIHIGFAVVLSSMISKV